MTFMRKILDAFNMENWHDYFQSECSGSCTSDLSKIYNGTLKKRKEEIISRDLLSTVGLCHSKSICKEAKDYLIKNHTRIELCVYAASLCIPPINNNELYIVSHAYEWAGANYRKEAIYYLKEYINHGAISDYIESFTISENGYSYDQRIKFTAIEHKILAELYSKECMFNEAIEELFVAIEIAPYLIGTHSSIARNYVKLGDYDSAISVLNSAKKSKFYKMNASFQSSIDNSLRNTIKKRDAGYSYTNRKKNICSSNEIDMERFMVECNALIEHQEEMAQYETKNNND